MVRPIDLRPRSAPAGGRLAVCPHCWNVERYALRLCSRCGADMTTVLQESGGLRATAPVQAPVPVRARGRLTLFQRVVVLGFAALLTLAAAIGVWAPGVYHPARPAAPAGP
ncbi:MAG TPA: hypothetical protein VF188_09145 [Longimicrobiales bacterium]